MKVSIVTAAFMMSLCYADLNILSFFTKIFDSNVKLFWNYLNIKKQQADTSIFASDKKFHHGITKIYEDNNEIFQHADNGENLILQSAHNSLKNSEEYQTWQEQKRIQDGFSNTILSLFGFTPSIAMKNFASPIKISNKTKGLDVRLKSTYFNKMLIETMKNQFKLLYPGTLWCGIGTIAQHDNQYGLFRKTDKCCRKHDSCPKYIAAGRTWKNLENNGIFTRSHCHCDYAFHTCLKRINSFVSNKIGVTYFNLLQPQCFRKEYPIVSCLEEREDNRCLNYIIDNSGTKQWQWFDNKLF